MKGKQGGGKQGGLAGEQRRKGGVASGVGTVYSRRGRKGGWEAGERRRRRCCNNSRRWRRRRAAAAAARADAENATAIATATATATTAAAQLARPTGCDGCSAARGPRGWLRPIRVVCLNSVFSIRLDCDCYYFDRAEKRNPDKRIHTKRPSKRES